MIFIDDYTRMCWVYLLKEKSKAFDTFKNFHLRIKNETQLNIGTLRSDNGGEYKPMQTYNEWIRSHANLQLMF